MINPIISIKQLVILSGKGGTGKTCISAGLIHNASQEIKGVYVDADVDAANLALVVGAKTLETHTFSGSQLAFIMPERCIRCGICYEVCRYDAIHEPLNPDDNYRVIDLLCDGCGSCVYACPESAINMEIQQDGEWFHSISRYGHLFHAELFPAAENTGKLVTTVKQHARLFAEDHQIPLMIVDGPPGIGCPVISASSGANVALLVAEPGVSGIHDLKRIIKTLEHFNIPILIAINKADIDPESSKEIIQLANTYPYEIVGEIPFDKAVPKAMVQGLPVNKCYPDSPASIVISQIWRKIYENLFRNERQS